MNLDPKTTALLAMDFQATILASLTDTDALVDRTALAIAAMRRAGGTVGFVRVAFTAADLAGFPAHSAMGQRMKGLGDKVLSDAPGTQLDVRLQPQAGDVTVRKRRVGPFSTTDLLAQLRDRGIETLVICGIHTSGCVLTCVREAHDLDFRIIVLDDCCADPDPAVHDFLTSIIFPKQAIVTSSAIAIEMLASTVEAR